jgi:hypothetical protein
MDETRLVEFLEPVKLGTDQWNPGDRKAFPKASADRYIQLGWVKCVETGEQHERVPGVQFVSANDQIQTVGG